ncbi:MAG: sigma-70 family RNA polymerase sigma factor, partial [Clostridiales bacterium]|nr:sigma-70 family RNA polymerase sigma factor [Clostridiales bacterium]
MTDKELEKIYNEAYRAVYWTAFSLLKNEDDAQDIVQDTFVSLINSYDSINDKTKILPWLKKVAANKSLNRLTRTKTDTVEDEFFDSIETVPE